MTHGSICSRALFSLKVLRLQEERLRQSEEAVKGKKKVGVVESLDALHFNLHFTNFTWHEPPTDHHGVLH